MDIDQIKNAIPEDIDSVISHKQIFDDPTRDEELKKLINSPHEIVFTVNAHVLTENEKGEITGSREISIKNYHIPVPVDKDYKHYMSVFFEYLENSILSSINKANETAKDSSI